MTSFDGETALVTGGGSGIGRATARRFAEEGADVVVVDVDETGGRETADAITEAGGEATFFEADVSSEEAVAAAVDRAYESYGSLEVLHNNAGISNSPTPLVEQDTGEFRQVLSVNVEGVFLGLKHAIPRMIADGGGAVVNTASIAGINGASMIGAYAATKHAVVGLTRTAAMEYASKGIRVNAVCPGFTDTPMVRQHLETAGTDGGSGEGQGSGLSLENTPQMRLQGRLAEPEEIADAVVWLASGEASYVNGVAFPVDGGMDAG